MVLKVKHPLGAVPMSKDRKGQTAIASLQLLDLR